MVKKEDARVLRTKKNIEETTITLLTTQPNFSITLLLHRADVTRGTFYKYYQNKEHLISEVNHTLIQEFIQYTQGKFHVAKMIQAVSDRAAFYNAVLNLHSNSVYVKTLIEDEELYRHQMFQWEIITGGFWALISKWLLDNMNVTQTKLLQEFIEVLRVDSTGWTQTGLNLFNFDNVN